MFDWQQILSIGSAWAYVAVISASRLDDFVYAADRDSSMAVRIVRGKRCLTKQSLFQEFAAALQFPYYFGHNWDAFSECLADLEWLHVESCVIVITDMPTLQQHLEQDYNTLLKILQRVTEEWDHELKPDSEKAAFRIIMHSETDDPVFLHSLLNVGVIPVQMT